ncbi:hypothetical protein [Shewanella sp. 10N.286.51.B7]|uniref:DUF6942 family protein n=1 Tax=Shewanella sp. 10N.286.51.B7 TaxID=1880836 RepID=UPI000C854588|nr:hypothetical protein [Shewanella sp. 10N.286.51.B7]
MIELTDNNMTSNLSLENTQSTCIGNKNTDIAFYLPNPPTLPANIHYDNPHFIKQIIELNGNHWRKIVTIMAKIIAHSDSADAWRECREDLFLPSPQKLTVKLLINHTTLNPDAKVHIICGQQALEELQQHALSKAESLNNFDINQAILHAKPIDEKQKIMAHKQVLITPYLDYRQFSNQQISVVRDYINKLL